MYIEEVNEGEGVESREGGNSSVEGCDLRSHRIDVSNTQRILVGAGARALFYPTLLYNVVRNKLQVEFRWWDRVDEFILLGAVPFPSDVPRLKELGVRGVITLNEPYETLVPTNLYHALDIDHLVIPTRDYCFAPSTSDITRAVNFIHEKSLGGQTTYVHCKAGRGRSTTVVICYLVQYKQMTPDVAYDYLRSIRRRVLLASSQWQAVQEFYHCKVKKTPIFYHQMTDLITKLPRWEQVSQEVAFDDSSVVLVTKSDLEGYENDLKTCSVGNEIWADVSVIYRFRVAGQSALGRISCLWVRYRGDHQNIPREKLSREGSCSIRTTHLEGISVDIQVC